MASKRGKAQREKRESGGFVALAFCVLRSRGYAELSPHAVKLLNDLLAQYTGNNNGDLCCAWTLMEKRGWRSKSTLSKARKELLDGAWIEVTRQGGRHQATLYALTFFSIDECGGKLDVSSTHSPKGSWRLKNQEPPKLNPLNNCSDR